jgi:hypothetical protein
MGKVVRTPPSMVAGGISRVVSDGPLSWVETWDGSAWVTGGPPIRSVFNAPPAPPSVLNAANVGPSDAPLEPWGELS